MTDTLRRAAAQAGALLRGAAARLLLRARMLLASTWTAMVTAEATPTAPVDAGAGWVRRWGGMLASLVMAAVLLTITVDDLSSTNDRIGQPLEPTMPFAAGLLAVAPLLLRHLAPLAAFRLSLLSTLVASGLVIPLLTGLPLPMASVVVVPVCTFAAVDRARTDIAAGALASALIGLLVLANVVGGVHDEAIWVTSTAVLAGTVVFAVTVRSRRQAQGALLVEEGRTAQQQAARAVLEERARIARELHDVVAHHMSVIAIQAEAAPLRARGDADVLTAELAEIRGTVLDSMREMRRILGVLREDADALPTAPAPDLSGLPELVRVARGAGLQVEVEELGDAVPLPATIGLSAYRIIQESLANAMRHAPGSTVAITLTHRTIPAVLSLEVHSTAGRQGALVVGPREGAPHGLVGMRERVAALGGDLSAGPSADGGFLVQARLPLEGV